MKYNFKSTLTIAAVLAVALSGCHKTTDVVPTPSDPAYPNGAGVITASGLSGSVHTEYNQNCQSGQVAVVLDNANTYTCLAKAGIFLQVQTYGRFDIPSTATRVVDTQGRVGTIGRLYTNGMAHMYFDRPLNLPNDQRDVTESTSLLGRGFNCITTKTAPVVKLCAGDQGMVISGTGINGTATGGISEIFDNGTARITVGGTVNAGEDYIRPINQLGPKGAPSFNCTPDTANNSAACTNLFGSPS